jgi:hypothetical protein
MGRHESGARAIGLHGFKNKPGQGKTVVDGGESTRFLDNFLSSSSFSSDLQTQPIADETEKVVKHGPKSMESQAK